MVVQKQHVNGSSAAGETAPTVPGVADQAVEKDSPKGGLLAEEREWTKPPCTHNNWEDVRQRKGIKMLRCAICNIRWRWARGAKRGDEGLERCIDFLNGECRNENCSLLHIHRSKKSLEERVKIFGSEVLVGVPQKEIKLEVMRKTGVTLSGYEVELERHSSNVGCEESGLLANGARDEVLLEPVTAKLKVVAEDIPNGVLVVADCRSRTETRGTFRPGPEELPAADDETGILRLDGIATSVAQFALGGGTGGSSVSGPSTPRGTAANFHKLGPPCGDWILGGRRKRAVTPPPAEVRHSGIPVDMRSRFVRVQNPGLIEFAKQACRSFLDMPNPPHEVFWEILPGRNNTIGLVRAPRSSTPYLRYVGSFTTLEECLAAVEQGQFYSFSWHHRDCPRPMWALQTYAFTVPNMNCSQGAPVEPFDPPVCDGVTTARLVVASSDSYQFPTFGSLTVISPLLPAGPSPTRE
eukprot:gene10244-15751_t